MKKRKYFTAASINQISALRIEITQMSFEY